jgi:hypothetical protein
MKLTINETSDHTKLSKPTIVEWIKMCSEKLCHLYDNIMLYKIGGLGTTVKLKNVIYMSIVEELGVEWLLKFLYSCGDL